MTATNTMKRKVGPRYSMSLLEVFPIEKKPNPAVSVSENWNTKSKMSYVGKTSNCARLLRFYITKYTAPGMGMLMRGMARRICSAFTNDHIILIACDSTTFITIWPAIVPCPTLSRVDADYCKLADDLSKLSWTGNTLV